MQWLGRVRLQGGNCFESLCLRGPIETVSPAFPDQRLDAKPVAAEVKNFLDAVVEGEGKHTSNELQRSLHSEMNKARKQRGGVRGAPELIRLHAQFLSQGEMIIDFTVVH